MKTEVYINPAYPSYEDMVEDRGPIYDSTALQKLADCPRYFQVREILGLEPAGPPSAKMVAGIAVHEGLEYFYSLPQEARTQAAQQHAVEIMQTTFDSFGIDRAVMDQSATHLTVGHLTQVMENYFHYWTHEALDIYEPIQLTLDDLDLSSVLAAKFKLNDEGYLILGESNIVMEFQPERGPFYAFAGKPDLPVRDQLGQIYVMDHKTTSSYLSDWWAKQFEVSNKMRIYMAMVRSLLGETPMGAIINGIYVGKYATNPDSKATKFTRFPFDFSPGHIDEAIENWHTWIRLASFLEGHDYYPQGCGYGGCSMPGVCRREPVTRAEVLATDYQPSTREFWDL